jgi:CopG family transcriptional regulator / antitoxin EndoAI
MHIPDYIINIYKAAPLFHSIHACLIFILRNIYRKCTSLLLCPGRGSGGFILAELKKILISLPDNLLKEVDTIVSMEKTNRSEFVRQAMKLYIRERRKIAMRDEMKKGYKEMAEINIKLAEICFDADSEQQQIYEERLGEME